MSFGSAKGAPKTSLGRSPRTRIRPLPNGLKARPIASHFSECLLRCTGRLSGCTAVLHRGNPPVHRCAVILQRCSGTLHLCNPPVHKCAAILPRCSGILQWCTPPVHKCATILQWCSNILHKCNPPVHKCAAILQRCSGILQWCNPPVHKCTAAEHLCTAHGICCPWPETRSRNAANRIQEPALKVQKQKPWAESRGLEAGALHAFSRRHCGRMEYSLLRFSIRSRRPWAIHETSRNVPRLFSPLPGGGRAGGRGAGGEGGHGATLTAARGAPIANFQSVAAFGRDPGAGRRVPRCGRPRVGRSAPPGSAPCLSADS